MQRWSLVKASCCVAHHVCFMYEIKSHVSSGSIGAPRIFLWPEGRWGGGEAAVGSEPEATYKLMFDLKISSKIMSKSTSRHVARLKGKFNLRKNSTF